MNSKDFFNLVATTQNKKREYYDETDAARKEKLRGNVLALERIISNEIDNVRATLEKKGEKPFWYVYEPKKA